MTIADQNRLELLESALPEFKQAIGWMLKSIMHKADELQGGNYSPELLHAISVGEMMEAL